MISECKKRGRAILFPYCVAMAAWILAGCGAGGSKSEKLNNDSAAASQLQPAPTVSRMADTIFVNEKTIVFVQPDSLRKERRIAQVGSGSYEGESNYFEQYLAHASNFAARAGIPATDAATADLIIFPELDSAVIVRDSLSSPWSLILYTPGKTPKVILPSDIRSEAAAYFNEQR